MVLTVTVTHKQALPGSLVFFVITVIHANEVVSISFLITIYNLSALNSDFAVKIMSLELKHLKNLQSGPVGGVES